MPPSSNTGKSKQDTIEPGSRVTLRMLAKEAGLSAMAISDIMNRGRAHLYDEKTVVRVLELAERFAYRPNRSAQALRRSATRTVAFCGSALSWDGHLVNQVVYPFLIGASEYLRHRHFHLSLLPLEEMKEGESGQQGIDDSFYDGLIVQQGGAQQTAVWRKAASVPLIWWDSGVFEPVNCLWRLEEEVGYNLTRELIALGHRRIACPWSTVSWVRFRKWQEMVAERGEAVALREGNYEFHYSKHDRYAGYQRAMEEAGLPVIDVVYGNLHELAAVVAERAVTAIMMAATGIEDRTAFLRVAMLAGRRVPEELSIASFDCEADLFRTSNFRIGGMLYDRLETGKKAGAMLLQRIEHNGADVPSERFGAEFSCGDSIGRMG